MSGINFFKSHPVVRIGGVDTHTYKEGGKDVEFVTFGGYVEGWDGQEKTSDRFQFKLFNRKGENSGDRVAAFKKMFDGEVNKGRKVQLEVVPSTRTRVFEGTYTETVDVSTLEEWVAAAKANNGQLELTIPTSQEIEVVEFVVRDFQPVDPPRTTDPKAKADAAPTKKVGIQIGKPAGAAAASGDNPAGAQPVKKGGAPF